jgi:hypothetical protein
MSKIKTDIIEPVGSTISISGNASMANTTMAAVSISNGVSVTGGMSVTGGAIVYGDIEVYNGGFIRSGGLSVTGNVSTSGKITTASTTGSDSSTTLTTKDYVDNQFVIFDSHVQILAVGTAANAYTARQTINMNSYVPSTAKYGIFTVHTSQSQENMSVWMGPSTASNSGHLVSRDGPYINSSVSNQVFIPINPSTRAVYWNTSGGDGNSMIGLFINGYI